MEESIDVKALRARFNNQGTSSSRDSESPRSPRPASGKPFSPITDTNTPSPHRPFPTVPGLVRPPLPTGLKPTLIPRAPSPLSSVGPVRALVPPVDNGRVRQTGELLQNMMLRHQRLPGPRLSPVPPLAQTPVPPLIQTPISPHTPASSAAHTPVLPPPPVFFTPIRPPQPKQRSGDDVPPLRRPLPPEGPMPLKPKRPANVNLEPHRRFARGASPRVPPLPTGPRTTPAVSPNSAGRHMPVPAAVPPPKPPQRDNKPGRLPRQATTVDIDDDQEMYDDVGILEKNESWSDNGSQNKEEDTDEVYEYIDEDQVEEIRVNTEKLKIEKTELKPNKKELKKLQEQEKREQQERQRREEQLKKNFQLQGEVEVLHTASVRHDWSGGSKLDLSVRQGERVEIIRVKNNPGGKWLARSLTGVYGYISNTCVDIDYEAIKRKANQFRKIERFDVGELPPPPPDPPGFNHRPNVQESEPQDEDDYDDVDFPPPPIELNIDPRVEKELRKKFKFEGPLQVLHTMMVDPNALIKKPGAKDLSITQGEILDVFQLNNKKALCRNQFGKFGYVNKSHLLPLEGDIYDDVEYPDDVYDNDNVDY